MQTKLEIKGMTCGHCVGAVEKALSAVAGVDQVIDVSKDNESAIIEGDADQKALVQAVIDEGYEARVI